MIISRWKGFEIDSSEGYYGFCKEAEDEEERWRYLHKILSSPLLWDKAAFYMGGKDGKTTEDIHAFLSELADKGTIETTEKYEYCPYSHAARLGELRAILSRFRENLACVKIKFCIRPLDRLAADESARLKTWYLGQFSDRLEGESRWRKYKTVQEKDFTLRGCQTYTDSFARHYAFEASLEYDPVPEGSLAVFMCAGDPSFIIYFIATIFPGYDVYFVGDHFITIDARPDKLAKTLES